MADRLGVTKGCLYHYFESKEKLLVELIRDRMGAAVDVGEDVHTVTNILMHGLLGTCPCDEE